MKLRVVFLLLAAGIALAAGSRGPSLAQTSQRCFAETGFCIDGRFRDYWEQNGGLPVFGFPIGPAQSEINRETGQAYLLRSRSVKTIAAGLDARTSRYVALVGSQVAYLAYGGQGNTQALYLATLP